MPNFIDLNGMRFGRLTVIERAENNKWGQTRWKCQCDCGNETVVVGVQLTSGKTKSCGCLNREIVSERSLKNLIGLKFGRLTVLCRAENSKNGKALWKCRCDCGEETVVDGRNLTSGHTKSCGCLKREITSKLLLKDLTGQKFGRLPVIERAENKGKQTAWKCLCDCGNEKIVLRDDLISGGTKSCGCYNREISSRYAKDLTGQKFGRLTVIERAGSDKKWQARWKCLCDCGKETVVTTNQLTSGRTKSCGCSTFNNLVGKHFGRLTVIERAENEGNKIYWKCRCDCGNEVVVHGRDLKYGFVKSCGCKKIRRIVRNAYSGKCTSSTWTSIKYRCFNPRATNYHNYGGRGITMYPEWIDNFKAFHDYVSQLPHFGEKGYSLDRIDVNGNYEPNNLRWADAKTQARNTRRNVFIDYCGEMITVAEAAEKSGIKDYVLRNRIKRGDRGEKLFRPVPSKTTT